MLFFAGIVPGLMTAAVYAISIYLRAKRNEKLAPRQKIDPDLDFKRRVKLFGTSWPILLVAFTILGGIYTGVFTPTEQLQWVV